MKQFKILKSILATLFLVSCGTTTYTLISNGRGQMNETRFNLKHVKTGCCGCSGVLVNTFLLDKLQSRLFIESNEGCPFNQTKFNFHYSSNGEIAKIDTLIAVVDSSFKYPITDIDKMALTIVDSFIATQNSSLYKVRKIDITGYRDKTPADKLMLLSPRLNKQALF